MLFRKGAVGLESRVREIDYFFTIAESKISAIFIGFRPILVIHFLRYSGFLFILSSCDDLDNGVVVPVAEFVFEIHQVPFFQSHPPLEVLAFGFKLRNPEGVFFQDGFLLGTVVEIGDNCFVFGEIDDLASRPADLICIF